MKIKLKIILIKLLLGLMFFPIAATAQYLDFKLVKIENSGKFCTFYFDATNKTGLNITAGRVATTSREADGSVISKADFGFQRIKKGETEVVTVIDLNGCKGVKEIRLSLVNLEVDGDYVGTRIISNIDNGSRQSSVSSVILK